MSSLSSNEQTSSNNNNNQAAQASASANANPFGNSASIYDPSLQSAILESEKEYVNKVYEDFATMDVFEIFQNYDFELLKNKFLQNESNPEVQAKYVRCILVLVQKIDDQSIELLGDNFNYHISFIFEMLILPTANEKVAIEKSSVYVSLSAVSEMLPLIEANGSLLLMAELVDQYIFSHEICSNFVQFVNNLLKITTAQEVFQTTRPVDGIAAIIQNHMNDPTTQKNICKFLDVIKNDPTSQEIRIQLAPQVIHILREHFQAREVCFTSLNFFTDEHMKIFVIEGLTKDIIKDITRMYQHDQEITEMIGLITGTTSTTGVASAVSAAIPDANNFFSSTQRSNILHTSNNNNMVEFIKLEEKSTDKDVEHALMRQITLLKELQNKQATARLYLLLDAAQHNLELYLLKHKAMRAEHESRVFQFTTSKSKISFKDVKKILIQNLKDIKSYVDNLGHRVIVERSPIASEASELGRKRDECRAKFISLYEEYKTMRLKENDLQSKSSEEFNGLENTMQDYCQMLYELQDRAIHQTRNNNEQDEHGLYQIGFGDMRLNKLDKVSMKPVSINDFSSFKKLQRSFEFHSDLYIHLERDIEKTLEKVTKEIKALETQVDEYSRLLSKQYFEGSEPNIDRLIEEVNQNIDERRRKSAEHAEIINEFYQDDGLDIEYEKELAIQQKKTRIDQLTQHHSSLNQELLKCEERLKKNQFDFELSVLDFEKEIYKENIVLGENEIASVQARIQDTLKEIDQLCKCNDYSLQANASSSTKYDFPEIPYPLIKKGALVSPKKNEQQNTLLEQMKEYLIKRGFSSKTSLKQQYTFRDLPEEVIAIANSDEVANSSIKICKFITTSSNSNKSISQIKALQGIDIVEAAEIRSAIELANSVRSDYVLPIEHAFVDEETFNVYVQTPFRLGGSMKRWLAIKPRNADQKLDVIIKVAKGLFNIHASHIVHGDIKLENVVMDSDNDNATPAIRDFSSSRELTGPFSQHPPKPLVLKGMKIGTSLCIAPRLFDDEKQMPTLETDVWSFVMMILIALVFDGDYEKIPRKPSKSGIDRVDIAESIKIAEKEIGKRYPKILDIFNRVLETDTSAPNAFVSASTPSLSNPRMNTIKINQVLDILSEAGDMHCDLCEQDGEEICHHQRKYGFECEHAHFVCLKHFRLMVENNGNNDKVFCLSCDPKTRKPISEELIIHKLGYDALRNVLASREAIQQARVEIEKELARDEGKMEGLKEAEKGMFHIQVTKSKNELLHLTALRCPRCKTPFERVSGCDAMKCEFLGCGAGFCYKCLTDCGQDAHLHALTCRSDRIQKIKADLQEMWNSFSQEIKDELRKDDEVVQILQNHNIQ